MNDEVVHVRWDLLGLERGQPLRCFHLAGDGGWTDVNDQVCVDCGRCGDCCPCVELLGVELMAEPASFGATAQGEPPEGAAGAADAVWLGLRSSGTLH